MIKPMKTYDDGHYLAYSSIFGEGEEPAPPKEPVSKSYKFTSNDFVNRQIPTIGLENTAPHYYGCQNSIPADKEGE